MAYITVAESTTGVGPKIFLAEYCLIYILDTHASPCVYAQKVRSDYYMEEAQGQLLATFIRKLQIFSDTPHVIRLPEFPGSLFQVCQNVLFAMCNICVGGKLLTHAKIAILLDIVYTGQLFRRDKVCFSAWIGNVEIKVYLRERVSRYLQAKE